MYFKGSLTGLQSEAVAAAADSIFGPRPDDQLRSRAVLDLLTIDGPLSRRHAARHYFSVLCRENWSLEWNLPRWVGQPLGLDPRIQAELVEINALALMALRLQDDLADGDLGHDDPLAPLAAGLLESVQQRTLLLLPPAHPFWDEYERRLQDWQRSQVSGHFRQFNPSDSDDRQAYLPAAPLHLSLQATCHLAHEPAAIQLLAPAIDEYLCALVLLDHLKDWPMDVASGHDNHFVQWMLPPDRYESPAEVKAAVWAALASDDEFSSYLAKITGPLSRAASAVEATKFKRLHHFFCHLLQEVNVSANFLQSRARRVLDELSGALLFPTDDNISNREGA